MRTLLISSLTTVLLGCAADPKTPPPDPGTTYNCSTDTRGETYTPGLDHMGNAKALDFKLMSSDPAPPSRGDNTWILEIDSVADSVVGGPVANLEAGMTATPFMPDHQHGSPIIVEITPVPNQPGQYSLDPVNLWMPGVWQTTIAVSGSVTDKTIFTFCLAE